MSERLSNSYGYHCSGSEAVDSSEPCECWEMNPDLLNEQSVLGALNHEPSLYPFALYLDLKLSGTWWHSGGRGLGLLEFEAWAAEGKNHSFFVSSTEFVPGGAGQSCGAVQHQSIPEAALSSGFDSQHHQEKNKS